MAEGNAQILVVDDNEMNRDMLSRRLRRQQYDVIVAEDGEMALTMVKEQSFDLVLLDIMMPNISGYDVLERLKADPQTRHLPIIMISAVDDLDSVVKCIELGAEDYLFKPFNPVLLKARVDATLRKNRLTNHPRVRSAIANIRESIAALQATELTEEQSEHLTRLTEQLTALMGNIEPSSS